MQSQGSHRSRLFGRIKPPARRSGQTARSHLPPKQKHSWSRQRSAAQLSVPCCTFGASFRRDLRMLPATTHRYPRLVLAHIYIDGMISPKSMSANDRCVLLFSGGRDSTIAAVRLARQFKRLFLVTITSSHMAHLDHVRSRVDELRRLLRVDCRWLLYCETLSFLATAEFPNIGCISCHFVFFWTASRLADKIKATDVSCGFTKYQQNWVEQIPYAITQLRSTLERRGQQLILPVWDVDSKQQAEDELRA
jgi:hypothetical protein